MTDDPDHTIRIVTESQKPLLDLLKGAQDQLLNTPNKDDFREFKSDIKWFIGWATGILGAVLSVLLTYFGMQISGINKTLQELSKQIRAHEH